MYACRIVVLVSDDVCLSISAKFNILAFVFILVQLMFVYSPIYLSVVVNVDISSTLCNTLVLVIVYEVQYISISIHISTTDVCI